MIQLDLKVVGAKNVKRAWDRLDQVYSKDLGPLFKIFESWWFERRLEAFESEGESSGFAWPEIGAIATGGPPGWYGEWKAAHYPGRPLLVRTGEFKKAVTGFSGSWKQMEAKWMKIGINGFPFWTVHRWGWTKRHVPMRDFTMVGQTDLKRLDEKIRNFTVQKSREMQREFGGLGAV